MRVRNKTEGSIIFLVLLKTDVNNSHESNHKPFFIKKIVQGDKERYKTTKRLCDLWILYTLAFFKIIVPTVSFMPILKYNHGAHMHLCTLCYDISPSVYIYKS